MCRVLCVCCACVLKWLCVCVESECALCVESVCGMCVMWFGVVVCCAVSVCVVLVLVLVRGVCGVMCVCVVCVCGAAWHAENLPVCRFKTSPCVGSKRFRVCWQNARMLSLVRMSEMLRSQPEVPCGTTLRQASTRPPPNATESPIFAGDEIKKTSRQSIGSKKKIILTCSTESKWS